MKGIRAMSMAPAATLVRRFVPSQSPTEETFRQGAHLATLDKLVRLRLYVAPVIGGLALTFAFFEPTPWRRWTIVAVVSWLLGLSVVEWWRSRRLGLAAVNLAFNYYALLAGQLALVIATGGLLSPLSPVMIVMSIMGGLLIPQATIHVLPLLMVPLVWVLAFVHVHHGLVPAVFGDGRTLETGALPWLAATVLTLMVTGATRAGAAVSDALERLFSEAVAERDRRLDGYAEQTSALSALSAEIAHELKNPLASVKGLSALVARDLEGKTAERMDVLRREVDRMQAILEEFLTYSRPLVPLAPEDVDLATVVRDVITLHEAMAAQRGVELLAKTSEPVRLRCDPRKVRQVLLNVVQNAIEATPAKGKVRLALVVRENDVSLLVDDEGSGLGELEPGRVFDVGFTTKDTGSGIGLAVARGLARQHGGELVLERRDEGGCRARLVLPRTLPEEPS
ncbi:MAG: HAMP domain-containing histidine kinase [Myxococcales bacterium]|nr:HAMP domain-containing histidine kinase [Myxococcales bacterium]